MAQIPHLNGANPAAPSGYQNARWQQGPSEGNDPTYGVPIIPDSCYVPNAGTAVVKTANYPATIADMGTLLVFNSSSALTLTLPNPVPLNALTPPTTETRWNIGVQNIGAGVLTISRNGLLIDALASNLTLGQNQGLAIYTDGANYFTERGVATPAIVSTAGIAIDGGGSTPTTGSKGFLQVPFAGTITGWTLIADVSGSASITVKKSTFAAFPTNSSIVASAPPTLSSQQNATSTTLTGWTTAVAAGDVLEFVLASATTVKRLVLELQIARS
jgi:hypothetical protein